MKKWGREIRLQNLPYLPFLAFSGNFRPINGLSLSFPCCYIVYKLHILYWNRMRDVTMGYFGVNRVHFELKFGTSEIA
jgi:hypothetical protein